MQTITTLLQWNHVFSNVEMHRKRKDRCRRGRRFNGTTFFQTWKSLRHERLVGKRSRFNGTTFFQTWKCSGRLWHFVFREASMEPRFFKRGNQPAGVAPSPGAGASMEPRFFKRGNASLSLAPSIKPLLLQWNHVFSNVEIAAQFPISRRVRRASMEPRFFKRGNNKEGGEDVVTNHASMEPRFFKRGNLFDDDNVVLQPQSFNGTTFFQTWKCPQKRTNSHRDISASMEPRFFKRGNRSSPRIIGELYSTLQWNHVFSNVEIQKSIDRMRAFSLLQWNHVFSNVEIFCREPSLKGGRVLQWNHVFSNVEIYQTQRQRDWAAASFNGTTFFQTWKCCAPSCS